MWWNVKWAVITAKILHRLEARFLNHSIPLSPFEVNRIPEREAISDTSKKYALLNYLSKPNVSIKILINKVYIPNKPQLFSFRVLLC